MSFEGDPTNRIEGLSPQSQSAMIGIMQGLISGVGFGNVYIESGENSPPVARVGFSMADQSMARYMQIPDFNDELVLLTINEQYRVKGLHPDVFIYGRQFIASDGEVYDIKAKKIGAEQFLYTVNEVVQDVDPLTGLGTSHSLKKKLKEIEVNIDRRLGDRERRREKRLKGTSSKTDELILQEEEPAMAVMFIDLDNLKTFNDKFGHSEGDKVIVDVAQILKASIREVDFVARTGGDEFVLVLPETDATKLQEVRERIEEILEIKNKSIPNVEKKIRLSIGVSSDQDEIFSRYCSPSDKITPETIKMVADQKMYVEKKAKKMISAIRGNKNSPRPSEPGYVPFLEQVFQLEKDEAWRVRQEQLGIIVNLLQQRGLFGDKSSAEAIATGKIIKEAILFQDLFTYVKDEDYSTIEDLDARRKKIDEANEYYSKVAPVNKIHPQLARDFVLKLKEAPLQGFDLDKIASIVEYQHAWVDGTTSPHDDDFEKIPFESKWLSLINAYVGMITNSYGRKKKSEQALEEIEKGKWIQFDADMADSFIGAIKEYNENNPWAALRMEM